MYIYIYIYIYIILLYLLGFCGREGSERKWEKINKKINSIWMMEK